MQHRCPICGTVLVPALPTCPACGALLVSRDAMQPAPPPGMALLPRANLRNTLIVVLPLGLLLVALGAGVFWFVAHQAHSSGSRPPLYANSLTADQHAWDCESGATCHFEPTGLHILAPTDHLYFSTLRGPRFADQVISVQGKLDHGDPQLVGLAIAFRSVGINGYGWLVFATGTYELLKWDDQGTASPLIPLTRSLAIHPGLNQINQLTIIATQDQITLVSNGQRLTQITDGTYGSGSIALGAARTRADAVFAHLSVTKP